MENGGAKRITISAIAAALVLGAVGGVAQRSAGYAFQASGGDAWAYRSMVTAMDTAAHLLTSPLFIIVACAAAGSAIYSWADFIVRKWLERWKQTEHLSFTAPDRKLFAMTLMLFFGGGFALSALWVAGERFLVQPPISAATIPKATTVSEEERAAIIAPFQEQIESLRRQVATAMPSKREVTTRTIRELRTLYVGRTRLQADAFMADEKGKLIDVEGSVVNVDRGMAFLQVGARSPSGEIDNVECRFGDQWNAKLGTFRTGDYMKIRGTIGPTQNGAQIYLQECEIIS